MIGWFVGWPGVLGLACGVFCCSRLVGVGVLVEGLPGVTGWLIVVVRVPLLTVPLVGLP